MREFILVAALCLLLAIVVDHVWLRGKIFGTKHTDFFISSVNRK